MTSIGGSQAVSEEMALVVRIAENLHALPIDAIEEVLPALPLEKLPDCPPFVRGVVFVRGHIIPIVDAAERLGLTRQARPLEPHIICLTWQGRLLGLEVDEALDLIDLHGATRLDAQFMGSRGGFFAGVVEINGELLRMLNLHRLLTASEAQSLEAAPPNLGQ